MNNIYSSQNINTTFKPFIDDDKGYQRVFTYKNPLPQNDRYTSTSENNHQEKRKHKGLIAAGTSIAIAGGLLFFAAMTGKTHNLTKGVKKVFGFFEKVGFKYKTGTGHKTMTNMANKIDRFSKVLTNVTPLKDYAFFKVMKSTKPTKAVWQGITNVFTKINKKATIRQHKKAIGSYNVFLNDLENILGNKNHKIVDKKAYEELKIKLGQAKSDKLDFFTQFDNRYKVVEKDMTMLTDEIGTQIFNRKNLSRTFVPQEILFQNKNAYSKNLYSTKNKISCSLKETSKSAQKEIDKINDIIYSTKDSNLQRSIREKTIEFEKSVKKVEHTNSQNREKVMQQYKEAMKEYKKSLSSMKSSMPTNDEKALSALNDRVNRIEAMFSDYKKGHVEDIRTTAKKAFGESSTIDKRLKDSGDKARKEIEKAISSELKMYDKQRDIVLGSGPTDVLGLLAPIALFSAELKKDKTTEDKVGTTLKSGIPIVGGTAAYLVSLASQFNGGPALMFSLGTAAVLNFVGKNIFKGYQDYKQEQRIKQLHPGQ